MTSRQLIILAFLLVQLVLVSVTFPVSELFSPTPLFHIDNAAHWYRITAAAKLAEVGNFLGYDPYFNAGTSVGIANNPAAKLPALLHAATDPHLSAMQIWKLYVFSISCIAAICAPLAVSLMKGNARAIATAGLFGILLWWCSIFRWYHTAGLVSFVVASYFGLLFVAMIYSYLSDPRGWPYLVFMGLLGALGMYVHPLFPLPVACWTLIFLAFNWKSLDKRRAIALMIVVPIISILPNVYWLYPVFIAEPLTASLTGITHQALVDWRMIWLGIIGGSNEVILGSKMYSTLALGTIVANFLVTDENRRKIVLPFTCAGVFWIFYSAFGASIDLFAYYTQPNRFMPVGYLMLVVPAGLGVASLLSRLLSGVDSQTRHLYFASAAALLTLALVNLNELRRELSFADIGHYGSVPPEVKEIGPYSSFILEWLNKNTTPSARVLFETSNGRIHDGSHIAGYLAYTSNREFIGGHYVFGLFGNFTDGFLFGKNISELSANEFRDYVNLYNIGWIVSHSPQSTKYFNQANDVTRMESLGPITTYRVDRQHSFFEKGLGNIAARDHQQLILSDLSGSEIILKYHFMRGLKSEPETKLSPVKYMDDPNPFLRIENPPKDLRIFFE